MITSICNGCVISRSATFGNRVCSRSNSFAKAIKKNKICVPFIISRFKWKMDDQLTLVSRRFVSWVVGCNFVIPACHFGFGFANIITGNDSEQIKKEVRFYCKIHPAILLKKESPTFELYINLLSTELLCDKSHF